MTIAARALLAQKFSEMTAIQALACAMEPGEFEKPAPEGRAGQGRR